MNMEENERKECSLYDRDRVAVGFLKKKRGSLLLKYVLIAVAAVVLIALVTVFLQNDGISGFFASLALGGSGNLWQGGDQKGEGGGIHGGVSDTEYGVVESEFESGSESEKNDSESCTEASRSTEPQEPETVPPEQNDREAVELDMSEAEKGNGYIINYSGIAVDAEGILEMGFQNAKYSYSERPVVLILHTHTSECYYDADKSDPLHTLTHSVVAVGERLAEELNSRGISTVHCTVIHDGKGSPYTNARETIKMMLDIYPTVEYIIDLHRAELYDDTGRAVKAVSPTGEGQIKLTVSSDGRKARDSLALALSLRRSLNENGRRLCMPVVFTDNIYNADLSPYYLKIDIGSVGNNAAEAIGSAENLAEAIAKILKI